MTPDGIRWSGRLAGMDGLLITGPADRQGGKVMVSTAEIRDYLGEIDYPENIGGIVRFAQSRGAPQNVIDVLRKLPDRQYGNVADLNQAIGDIE